VSEQLVVQEWQPFFITLGGACAALTGLVFVAMSLHPEAILSHSLMRGRAFVALIGFLTGVVWSLIMLLPARVAPARSILLIVLGGVGIVFLIYQQFRIRKIGLNVARAALGDILILIPLLSGIVGLLQPASEFPFLLLAIAGCVGLFVLFSQSWTLVMHNIASARESQHQEPQGSATPRSAE
jgi:hypothetical protein